MTLLKKHSQALAVATLAEPKVVVDVMPSMTRKQESKWQSNLKASNQSKVRTLTDQTVRRSKSTQSSSTRLNADWYR
jgi:hypothetical protein